MEKIPDNLNFWKTILENKEDRKNWLKLNNNIKFNILSEVLFYLKENDIEFFNKIDGHELCKGATLPKKQILIVDDEEINRNLIQRVLRQFDIKILLAKNGTEAMLLTKSNNIDLIFLDLMMPKMDGFKVCGLLKNDKRYNDIPIVIMTAVAGKKEIDLCIELGADYVLTKPIEIQSIKKLVFKYLHLKEE